MTREKLKSILINSINEKISNEGEKSIAWIDFDQSVRYTISNGYMFMPPTKIRDKAWTAKEVLDSLTSDACLPNSDINIIDAVFKLCV